VPCDGETASGSPRRSRRSRTCGRHATAWKESDITCGRHATAWKESYRPRASETLRTVDQVGLPCSDRALWSPSRLIPTAEHG